MAGTNTIREFLVGLGFKIDADSWRKFNGTLRDATNGALKLGAAVEGAALAVEAAAVRIASAYERMYWASQRTQASVRNTKSFEYAVSQLGGTAEGARQSLEGFADFLRRYPGGRQFVERFGVNASALRDTTDVIVDFGERIGKLSKPLGIQLAQQVGIDYDTLLAITRGLREYRTQYDALTKQSGLNPDNLAKQSTHFMQQVRSILLSLDVLQSKVFGDLMDKYGPRLDEFAKYLQGNIGNIAKQIEGILDKLLKLADAIDHGVQALGGWKNVLEDIVALKFASWAVNFIAALALISSSPGFIALAALFGAGIAFYKLTTDIINSPGNQPTDRTPASGGGKLPGRGVLGQISSYFTGQGYSGSATSGLLASVIRESRGGDPFARGPNGAYGLFQWLDKTRIANYEKLFGHSIYSVTDRQQAIDEQLSFAQWELTHTYKKAGDAIRGAVNPGLASNAVSGMFEQFGTVASAPGEFGARATLANNIFGGMFLGAQGGGGGAVVHQNNKTDIHVSGAGHPAALASEIAGQQGRVFADASRQVRGAIDQ